MDKPNYINPNPKKISELELRKILKEVHEKQELERAEAWIAAQKELHHGAFVCAPAWVHRAMMRKTSPE